MYTTAVLDEAHLDMFVLQLDACKPAEGADLDTLQLQQVSHLLVLQNCW